MKSILKTYFLQLILITGFSTSSIYAQNEEDALRYSLNGLSGTARFVSMGGAFTSLGGDHSAISLNPASVGIFRKSEFTFSPAFFNANTKSTFNNDITRDSRLNINAANIGYLGNFYTGRTNWKSASIAVGYNRVSNYNDQITYSGISPGSSILDHYVANLNRNGGTLEDDVYNDDPFGAGPAYFAYLINPTPGDSTQYDHVLDASENLYQEMNISRSGGKGEYYMAFGGNFNDRIYMGGSINLSTLRFREESTYKEIPDQLDETNDLVELRRYENLLTTGTGVNFKFGIIGRVNKLIRLGATIHSPTYYRMSDNWNSQTDADYENGDSFREESPSGSFDYTLRTPVRVASSIGFVIGKAGIISGEYEFSDYSSALLNTPRNGATGDYDFNLENQRISTIYRPAGIIKAGTEWRLDPLRIRAGYNYRQNTYDNSINEDNSASVYTFGIGGRFDGYYIDLGYALTQQESNHYPYPDVENPASNNSNTHNIVLTVGFRY